LRDQLAGGKRWVDAVAPQCDRSPGTTGIPCRAG